MAYLSRTLERVIARAAREFPVVVLTGPRQSGKTTLLRRLFSSTHRYASLDAPDVRAAAAFDPRGLLDTFGTPVILDEVQHAPDLLPYIRESVDTNRRRAGAFVLTGSQNLLLLERVTETLAGRAAILRLLPLSQRESVRRPDDAPAWEASKAGPVRRAAPLWPRLLRGQYPELVTQPRRDERLWHASYVQTYLERDVRTVRQVGDLTQFQAFLQALAARSGQMLNLADIGRDLGVALNTVKAWVSVLEATHQIVIVRPLFRNVGKRLVKTPKVYFTDTGTLCYLVGLQDAGHARRGPIAGAIFETAVLTELLKVFLHRGREPRVWFWRTSAGEEVDFVVQHHDGLVPIEAKLSATPRPAMADAIRAFRRALGSEARPGYVVHPGRVTLPLGPDASALPFDAL